MIEQQARNVLHLIVDRLKGKNISWVIYGGVGLALHGLDFKVHDIDILTDLEGFTCISNEFKEYATDREISEKVSICRFSIDGMTVECKASVSHSPLIHKKDILSITNHPIPVISLEGQLQAYQICSREKDMPKIDAIKQYQDTML